MQARRDVGSCRGTTDAAVAMDQDAAAEPQDLTYVDIDTFLVGF